jgi:alpha-L-fucosidase 2
MAHQRADALALWYDAPAAKWTDALPLGNGRLGAVVFGGVSEERLALNELTLWAGGPHDYDSLDALDALPEIRRLVFAEQWIEAQALCNEKFMGRPIKQMPYQTAGDLRLRFPEAGIVTEYRRELDLETAVARVTYKADGVSYRRDLFVSVPDQVLVMRLFADQPGTTAFTAAFDGPPHSNASTRGSDITVRGTAGGAEGVAGVTQWSGVARLLAREGTVQAADGQVTVTGADAALVIVSLATSYKSYADTSGDPDALAANYLEAAVQKPYAALLADHVADYQRLFHRVTLDLGASPQADKPTDMRLRAFQTSPDPALAALHFQYGRYLLISSSRPGGQPANLQGLWNESLDPAWGSKYTININTEMNYWLAETCGLSECAEPLFQMVAELAETGRHTAKVQYGARGWVAHHNTDAWRGTAPVDGALWGMWMTGGAWLCTHLWEHYLFTSDQDALARHYPILKSAAEFFLDTLVEEPAHGRLVTCPSISPENSHHPGANLCAGPTMDCQILRDLFGTVIEAAGILGVDAEFGAAVSAARARLAPMQIGRSGKLQEWLEDWDDGIPEPHHRHVSHLYGLHPSSQITKRGTPELFGAARASLEGRGDAGTGWSLAWKINHWARLEDGDRAWALIQRALTFVDTDDTNYHGGGGVYANLFDAHPPFQIDGNFGFTAGVAEMLLQSHAGELHLLPALPSAWLNGSVSGLQARGGLTVGLAWAGGVLESATLAPRFAGTIAVRWRERVLSITTAPGETITLTAADFGELFH